MDPLRELIAQSMPHLIANAARSSENGVNIMLDPTLYEEMYRG